MSSVSDLDTTKAVNTNEYLDDAALSFEKQDRKRLKKLRKRVTNVISDGERSGLLTKLEWQEWKTLVGTGNDESASLVGPSVGRRKRKESNKVEGSHHRDLIAWFMDRIRHPDGPSQMKKRKHKEVEDILENPCIPSWASIHNPAAIDSILILEINVKSCEQRSQLVKCQSAVDAAVAKSKGRKALHLPTKWFQGHIPKSMSDGLFYFVCNPKHSKPSKPDGSSGPSRDELIQSLQDMILPLNCWTEERYPTARDCESLLDETTLKQAPPISLTTPLDAASINLSDAIDFVSKRGFRVEHQNEDDTHLYLATRPACNEEALSDARIFGMDCEMVLTSMGSELARITLVELNSFKDDRMTTTTVLDLLVKPENPVKDYLTRHSGMTADLLEPVDTRLAQIQTALWQYLRPNDILVGHSLENDLMAAHYIHPRIIDTALAFRHRNKRTKFSLRHMAACLLKKSIQQGSHCSKEDAEATLELAIRRAWLGDVFALPDTDERRSILEKWNGNKETKAVCIGPPGWLQTHVTNHANGVHALGYETIVECKKAIFAWTKGPRKAQLTWSRINISDDSENDVDALEQLLSELLLELSPSTIVLVAFQEGLDNAREGFTTRRACQDPRSSVRWSSDREALWRPVLETCRHGLASWIGATSSLPDK